MDKYRVAQAQPDSRAIPERAVFVYYAHFCHRWFRLRQLVYFRF